MKKLVTVVLDWLWDCLTYLVIPTGRLTERDLDYALANRALARAWFDNQATALAMSWRSERVVVPPRSIASMRELGMPAAFASSSQETPRL